jgi:hypothetical protein
MLYLLNLLDIDLIFFSNVESGRIANDMPQKVNFSPDIFGWYHFRQPFYSYLYLKVGSFFPNPIYL